jgi:MinD superfamily P-loop ATPase
MKAAIASGKGGTGKTMVSASLCAVWNKPVTAVDLDVEEPNLHLFLDPQIAGRRDALMEVPQVDETRCTYCRACADLCRYKAISVLNSVVLVFPEMCHGCGGCMAVCPTRAISTGHRTLGEIAWGTAGSASFLSGRLRVGEAMSPPLIRQVMAELKSSAFFRKDADVLMDAPPGVSCPAVNAVMDSDIIVLVTEPTPFGVYDLDLAVQAFEPLGKPMGVVVNRAGLGDEAVYRFCKAAALPIFAQIPHQRAIAETYAAGKVVALASEQMHALFVRLAEIICHAAGAVQELHHA